MHRYYMSAGARSCARPFYPLPGNTATTPGGEEVPGPDGVNGTEDDITLDIEGDFTVLPDGTIELPEGSTATTPDGEEVTGPAVIYPLFIPRRRYWMLVHLSSLPFIWVAAVIRPLPIRSSVIQPSSIYSSVHILPLSSPTTGLDKPGSISTNTASAALPTSTVAHACGLSQAASCKVAQRRGV